MSRKFIDRKWPYSFLGVNSVALIFEDFFVISSFGNIDHMHDQIKMEFPDVA